MSVAWVGQEDRLGCSIACVAMITGQTYQEAKASLIPFGGHVDGVPLHDAMRYLESKGFEQCGYRSFGYDRKTEKVTGFSHNPIEGADVTWCVVVPTKITAHSIIMLPDGTVMDPASPDSIPSLASYPLVESLRGFRRVFAAEVGAA